MKLNELIQKESTRLKEEIKVPQKPIFKKERNWLEDNTENSPKIDIDSITVEKNINKLKKQDENIEKISLNYVKNIETEENYRKPILKIENKLSSKHRKDILISIDKPFNFHSVVGLQQRTMFLIFEHCKMNGSKETSPLGINYFTEKLNISQLNAHNALNELLRKKVIVKTQFKRGRGGYFCLKFEESIWNIINLNIEKISLNYVNKNIEQTIETESNSSSNISTSLKKELTTIEIPENLKTLISQKEINRLLEKGAVEDSLVFSLKHFSYDLENNLVRSKTSPINMFYGIVKGGNTYKSLKLIELENEELRNYQSQLQKAEEENKLLKEKNNIKKYQDFLKSNPDYIQKIKSKQTMSLSQEVLEKIAYTHWEQEQNNEL